MRLDHTVSSYHHEESVNEYLKEPITGVFRFDPYDTDWYISLKYSL